MKEGAKMGLKMNVKHKAFVIEYLKNGLNGSKAYKAVYNSKDDETAKVGASRLLTYDNVKKLIEEMQEKTEEAGIMSIKERQEFLTRIITGEEMEVIGTMDGEIKVKPRIKTKLSALDLLNKMSGAYTEKREISINKPIVLIDDLTELEE